MIHLLAELGVADFCASYIFYILKIKVSKQETCHGADSVAAFMPAR